MMEIFFKYAGILLSFIGTALGLGIFVVYDFVFPLYSQHFQSFLWLLFILLLTLYGLICGKLIQKCYHLAHRDHLTNLWNRRYFYTKLAEEVSRLKRTNLPLCMALIDIDDFKSINDVHGHFVGDEVLKEVAVILTNSTRAIDTVVRLGGDEFAIILSDTNIEAASAVAERVREVIESSSNCHQTTISVGVLLIQAEMEVEVDQILKLVDETLYTAKNTKNLVVSTVHS
jgi:diguanylate cyclase (GGDEF)-like protein